MIWCCGWTTGQETNNKLANQPFSSIHPSMSTATSTTVEGKPDMYNGIIVDIPADPYPLAAPDAFDAALAGAKLNCAELARARTAQQFVFSRCADSLGAGGSARNLDQCPHCTCAACACNRQGLEHDLFEFIDFSYQDLCSTGSPSITQTQASSHSRGGCPQTSPAPSPAILTRKSVRACVLVYNLNC